MKPEELTWEDIKKIVRIADYLMYDAEELSDKPYYEEVLRRFMRQRNDTRRT